MPFPGSKKQIAGAGDRIAKGEGTDADEQLFAETLEAYDELRHEVQGRLSEIAWTRTLGTGLRS